MTKGNHFITITYQEAKIVKDILSKYIPIAAPLIEEKELAIMENLLQRLQQEEPNDPN